MQALVVESPAGELEVAEADVDPFGAVGHDRSALSRGAYELGGRPLPVARIEAEHEVGAAEHVLRHAHVERMARGKVEAAVDGVYREDGRLGERDQGIEALGLAADGFRGDPLLLRRRNETGRGCEP